MAEGADTLSGDVTPPGFREIQRQELSRLFGRALSLRTAAIVPLGLVYLLVLLTDPAPWRAWFLGANIVLIAIVAVVELLRFRRHPGIGWALPLNLAAMGWFQLAAVFATGGLESPLLPIVLPISVVAAVLVGRRPALLLMFGLQQVAVWAFAIGEIYGWLPDVNLAIFGGGARAGHNDAHLWTSAAVLSAALFITNFVGTSVRGLFDGMVRGALSAREDELRAHRDHAAELTALSGEIAHELKNPLATVKGLTALMERDAEGRNAERLAVLRVEVDRMRDILDEFLNFSRPLVPLTQSTVDLARLVDEVATLHEGVAHQRQVSVVVDAAPCSCTCDPRKVRQVLINLLQNAIDATPPGARVRLVVTTRQIEVLDRGPGPGDDAEALFAPGHTTKARGSGLGLTIARALARQHGGDLVLLPREGGGTCARLTLPEPP